MTLPRATQPFVDFASLLREHGFAVSPDQTIDWIAAIGMLGPNSIDDIYRAARALFAITPDRLADFNALFELFFHDRTIAAAVSGDDDDDIEAHEPSGGEAQIELAAEELEAGPEASTDERLTQRNVESLDDAALTRFSNEAAHALPRRRTYRRQSARRGDSLDMRKTLREAVRRDGEVLYLPQRRRRQQQRRILLLVDVSGSMTQNSSALMRFAHALANVAERFECFTLGTRLTRVTAALKLKDQTAALQRVSELVADYDGGTRIGDAMQALLAVPRYAGYARGATVLVLSDGLERDDPAIMIDAVRRLSRTAWRLVWLSPLAGSEGYQPETAALASVLPWLDRLDDASSVEAICSSVLRLARAA